MIQQILHVCIFLWRIIFAMTSHKQIIWSLFREGWGAGVHKHDPRAGGVVQIPKAIARHMLYYYIVCLLSEVCRPSEDVHGGRQGHQVNKHIIIRTSVSFLISALLLLTMQCLPRFFMVFQSPHDQEPNHDKAGR